MPDSGALDEYRRKRDFSRTPEPLGDRPAEAGDRFVVQKHAARRTHFDLRLEVAGVLKSWAVTRGPSLDPAEKRLAVRTEDHPLDYRDFEGVIPSGYGAGTVMLWDRGRWRPHGNAAQGLRRGRLKFELDGARLRGAFSLVRMRPKSGDKRENWLLIKSRDEFANAAGEPAERWARSVSTMRTMEQIRLAGQPAFIPPALALLRDSAPAGSDWAHEVKFDGYRLQAVLGGGRVDLYSRNRNRWTRRYPSIAAALAELPVDSAVIDGELVAIDVSGHASFSLLQNAEPDGDTRLVLNAFDLLHLNGRRLTERPLLERKEQLEALCEQAGDGIQYSRHLIGEGGTVAASACKLGLEGIISKRVESRYRSGRTGDWIKTKCTGNDEFVIGGYRRSCSPGREFSSLLVGEFIDGRLCYRGRVGSGFDERARAELGLLLCDVRASESPFDSEPSEARDRAVWVRPVFVAQVRYAQLTPGGRLRHASYLGLRADKSAQGTDMAKTDPPVIIQGVRVSHPHRVLYPEQGVTKVALAEYYSRMAKHLLPHISGRPLSVVRCPEGRGGECFYQKHAHASVPEEIERIEITERKGTRRQYLTISSTAGLVGSAQIGALELHIWGCRGDRLERPDRIVFDLDPDNALSFSVVRNAARETRDILKSADLESFALLTGGKGIHVVVPIRRTRSWDDIKLFARGMARSMERAAPERYVATASKAKRKGRVFIDWLRNERGATAICPYSPRARRGAPVATPVAWSELNRCDSSARYTLSNIERRIKALKQDPWEAYGDVRQSITRGHLDFFADDE